MSKNKNNKLFGIIYDENFVRWVLNPDHESDLYWDRFIKEHPLRKGEFEDAIYLIKALNKEEKELANESVLKLWQNIQDNKKNKQDITKPFVYWLVAASFLLAIGIGTIVFNKNTRNTSIDYHSIARTEPLGNEVKLILSDKSEKLLTSEDPEIRYNMQGEIEVDSTRLVSAKTNIKDSNEEHLNQLVVPRGKRSNLTLSDGTILILNAGSRVIYPVAFNGKRREIYVEGEVYLDVAHNTEKPFYVVTDNLTVRILGTEFNVSAYPDDANTSVVLVNGSVQAFVESKKILMKENQLLTLKNDSKETFLRRVDVFEHISWKDGWMLCNNQKLGDIAVKLARYYNVKVQFKDQYIKEMTISGKLDLKSSCEEVFDVIRFIAPIDFNFKNEEIIIYSKNSN